MRALIRLALVAIVYWVAARLSLMLALVHGQVTPVWPPTGIALVAILIFGRQVWPAVFAGALAVNLPIGPTPLGALVIAAGNTLAPLVAAELLRLAGFRLALDRLRDAAAIIGLAALLSMSISATVGSSVLVLTHAVSSNDFWSTWAVWWTGDAMGVLLVAPFLLSFLPSAARPRLTLHSAALLAGLLLGIGIVTFALFENRLRLEYLVFPLIMVAAWRFHLRGAAPAALMASGIAIWSAVEGTGPFATETLVEKMITLQVFNVCVALTSLVLATFVATRERQEEVIRQYAASNAAGEARTSFLNLAAHELRTPLAVLTGHVSMLADGSHGRTPDSWKLAFRTVIAKTAELNKIVETLLQASQAEIDATPLAGEVIDLRQVIDDAMTRARPRADLLRADISTTQGREAVLVEADKGQLGRVLDNLINNGLSYSAAPARVFIGLATESRRAVVRVEDSGEGIPEEQREQVFEQFYRGAGPMVARVPGVGLGLHISRQLAEHNGGSLVIESSTLGAGTVFALTLPLANQRA